MNRLELLVPPPIVMLVTGLLMWLARALIPGLSLSWLHQPVLAAIIALVGMAIVLISVFTFKRLRTTADPRRPQASKTLATSGIYRYSRNPMYLGVLLILIGWGLFLGNLISVLCTLAFMAYITRYQILPEERALHDRFGDDFLAYKARVRRWIGTT